MQEACSGNPDKIKIGGVKMSPELVQINLFRKSSPDLFWTGLFRQMAEDRINLTFFTQAAVNAGFLCNFCVLSSDFHRVENLLQQEDDKNQQVRIIAPVGTITIFPHHHSFTLLGCVIGILGRARIPVHAVCTSLSSVAINADYVLLDQALKELRKVMTLPVNHAPFRADLDSIRPNSYPLG